MNECGDCHLHAVIEEKKEVDHCFSVQVHRKTQKRQEKKVEGEGSELVRVHVTPSTLEGGGERGIMSQRVAAMESPFAPYCAAPQTGLESLGAVLMSRCPHPRPSL
jgi:hypothetical protein